MTLPDTILPSWRPGPTRDRVTTFLEAARSVPVADRFACFDNDGTLWCERPTYVQFDFLVDELRAKVHSDPTVADSPEFAAVLSGDRAAMGELGLQRIVFALTELFDGWPPAAFAARVRDFMERGEHAVLARPLRTVVYQPMIELIAELRRLDFTIALVTGGGTEFVRAVSADLYGVPPELVVGTLVKYDFGRDDSEQPMLRRTNTVEGDVNEGAAKVTNIQTQLGRRPILAAGNSGGDREMLEWACTGDTPGLAVLIDHDDDQREFHYIGTAESFAETEPITDVAARLDWTVVSMANDWTTVFPSLDASPTG